MNLTDTEWAMIALARVAVVERAKQSLAAFGVADIEHHPIVIHARMAPIDPNDLASARAVLGWIEAAGYTVKPQ